MDVMLIIFLFAFGACVGSFLNVLIYRLPREESIVFPGSHCPRCGVPINWYDNIPIISWLALRGRCRSCGGEISPRYIVVELLTGLLVAGLYVCYFVLHVRGDLGPLVRDWPAFAAHAVLLCGLLACSAVDIELFIVPLPVMWFCAAVGVAAAAYRPGPAMPTVSVPLSAAAVGAALGLIIAKVLLHYGYIQESFLDAEETRLLLYANSGDLIFGDRERVVGYAAFAIWRAGAPEQPEAPAPPPCQLEEEAAARELTDEEQAGLWVDDLTYNKKIVSTLPYRDTFARHMVSNDRQNKIALRAAMMSDNQFLLKQSEESLSILCEYIEPVECACCGEASSFPPRDDFWTVPCADGDEVYLCPDCFQYSIRH